MEKQFVTYEIAKQLKDLGFDEECFGEYRTYKNKEYLQIYQELDSCSCDDSDYEYITICVAPLWQQVFDWFREKHNIIIEISSYNCQGKYIGIHFKYLIEKTLFEPNEYDEYYESLQEENGTKDYYEAREQAILKAILCQKEK